MERSEPTKDSTSFLIVNPNNLDEIYEHNEENEPYQCYQGDEESVANVNSSLEFLWNMDESIEQTDATKAKRKHVVATIYDKLEILNELEEGKSITFLSKKYGLGKSTIHDLRKKKDMLRKYSVSAADSIFGIRHRRTMRESPFFPLDRALLQWFREERAANRPVSGPQCCQRARQLFITLGLEGTFDASTGWLSRWKDRHGIRSIGNSLDFIKWPEGHIEEHNTKSSLSTAKYCKNTTEHELLAEPDDSLSCGYKSIVQKGETDPSLDGTMEQNDENTSDNVEKSVDTNNIQHLEVEKDPGGTVIPNIVSNRISIDDLTYLKFLVKKLEKVTNKIDETSKEDSHDEFGKYISSLIRKLPPAKVIHLKQKLVSEVLDVLLAHEKGLPDPILCSEQAERQDPTRSSSVFKEKSPCVTAQTTPTVKVKTSKVINSSPASSTTKIIISSNRSNETRFHCKKKPSSWTESDLPDDAFPTSNSRKVIITKSGRKIKPPKIMIEESPPKRDKKPGRKGIFSGKATRTNHNRKQNKWDQKHEGCIISTVQAEGGFNMDTEDEHEHSDIKPNIDYNVDATGSTENIVESELIQIKEEIPDYEEYPSVASCETVPSTANGSNAVSLFSSSS